MADKLSEFVTKPMDEYFHLRSCDEMKEWLKSRYKRFNNYNPEKCKGPKLKPCPKCLGTKPQISVNINNDPELEYYWTPGHKNGEKQIAHKYQYCKDLQDFLKKIYGKAPENKFEEDPRQNMLKRIEKGHVLKFEYHECKEFKTSINPHIIRLSPEVPEAGEDFVIFGNNFGNKKSFPSMKGQVLINGKPVKVLQWNDSDVTVRFPSKTTPGEVMIKITLPSDNKGKSIELLSNSFMFQAGESKLIKALKSCRTMEAHFGCTALYETLSPVKGIFTESSGIKPDGSMLSNGNMVFIPGAFDPHSISEFKWNGNRFTLVCNEKEKFLWTAESEIDTDNEIIRHLKVKVVSLSPKSSGTWYTYALKNIPIVRKSLKPFPLLVFEISEGKDLSEHLTEIEGYYHRETSDTPAKIEEKKFMSIDWEKTSYQPFILVMFFCVYDKRRMVSMQTRG